MPTTNPVPSTDPSDLLFNAGKLDEVVNGAANSFTDRFGSTRRTVAGMNADFDAQLADAESDLNVYRADAAASAAEALGYLQTIRATSYGAYASDPATDPLGNPPTVGDEYFNTTSNLLKRWNGTTWQASDINTANLAAPSGSSLIGYDDQTVQDVLDGAKSLQDYAALRAYTGRATRIYITGLPATAKPAGIAGVFQHAPTDTTSADNGGTIIVGTDGRRWKRDFSGAVNVKWFGAKGDWSGIAGTDDTAAFNAAISVTPEYGTLEIPDSKFLIRGSVNVTNKNINIECSGTIVLTDEAASTFNFINTESLSFPGTALAALPKIGDSSLSWATSPAGVDDASKYFFVLNSTENEITRVGVDSYTPYTKNEAGDITTWSWLLRAPVKLDYTDASKLTVRLYKKRDPVAVRGLRIELVNLTGQTSKTIRLNLFGVSNVNFDCLTGDNSLLSIPGQTIRIDKCCGLTFSNSTCVGPNGPGDTYAWTVDTAAFLLFDNCEYRNPYNALGEVGRGYTARHGANVTFRNCRFNGIDDHYGHDYLVDDMTFNFRGVSFAGGNITLRNCHHTGSRGLFEIRTDAPYAYGTLRIEGCTVDGSDWLVTCVNDTDPLNRGTKVKFFDKIVIKGTTINGRKPVSSLVFRQTGAGVNTLHKTKKLVIEGVVHNKLYADIRCALFGEPNSPTPAARWVERIDFIDIDYNLIVTKTTGSFSEITSISLRDLWADEVYVRNFKNFLPYGNAQIGKMTVVDSYIGPATGTNVWIPAGKCDFKSCEIDTVFSSLSGSTAVFTFSDCIVNSSLYGTSADSVELKNKTAYLSRNKATPSVSLANAPGGSIEYYINPTYYKTA